MKIRRLAITMSILVFWVSMFVIGAIQDTSSGFRNYDDSLWDALGDISLTSAEVIVGNASNVAAAVAMSGDVTIINDGTTTVADDSHAHVYSNIDATTSANWIGRVSDETGTGVWVFGTSPTLATPVLTLPDGNGAAPTTDGEIKFDRTTERLQAGDGSGTNEFYPNDQSTKTTDSPTLAALDITGDISAAGGFRVAFNYRLANLDDTQTDVFFPMLGLAASENPTVPFAGSVIGIGVSNNFNRTAGTATFEVTVNETGTGFTTEIDDDPIKYSWSTQAKDTDTFSAGDRIGVTATTDASWAPTTTDPQVTVIVEM